MCSLEEYALPVFMQDVCWGRGVVKNCTTQVGPLLSPPSPSWATFWGPDLCHSGKVTTASPLRELIGPLVLDSSSLNKHLLSQPKQCSWSSCSGLEFWTSTYFRNQSSACLGWENDKAGWKLKGPRENHTLEPLPRKGFRHRYLIQPPTSWQHCSDFSSQSEPSHLRGLQGHVEGSMYGAVFHPSNRMSTLIGMAPILVHV